VSVVRAYVPSTLSKLAHVVAAGGLGPVPVLAHAVTEALRADLPEAGEDEWEYAALCAAAVDSIGMLDLEDLPRRVVIAVDTGTVVTLGGGHQSLVEIHEVVPFQNIAAVHVDSDEAEKDVVLARALWVAEGPARAATRSAAERCLDHELGWYAAQEISDIVAG